MARVRSDVNNFLNKLDEKLTILSNSYSEIGAAVKVHNTALETLTRQLDENTAITKAHDEKLEVIRLEVVKLNEDYKQTKKMTTDLHNVIYAENGVLVQTAFVKSLRRVRTEVIVAVISAFVSSILTLGGYLLAGSL